MIPRSSADDELHDAYIANPQLRGVKCEGFHADTLTMARMFHNGRQHWEGPQWYEMPEKLAVVAYVGAFHCSCLCLVVMVAPAQRGPATRNEQACSSCGCLASARK